MYLNGFGDPTHGHGGMSYVKLPLKTSRYEKDDNNKDTKKSMVTGTNADLRKLPMSYVISILKQHGYHENHLKMLMRWEKIALLRKISNTNNFVLKPQEEQEGEENAPAVAPHHSEHEEEHSQSQYHQSQSYDNFDA